VGLSVCILASVVYWVFGSTDDVSLKTVNAVAPSPQEQTAPDTTFEVRTWTNNEGKSYKLYIPTPGRFTRDGYPSYDTYPDPLLEYDTLGWQEMLIPVIKNGEQAYMKMHNWERNLRYYWNLKETHKPTSTSFGTTSAAPAWTWKYSDSGYTALIRYEHDGNNLPDILKFGDTTVFVNDWNVDDMPLLVLSHANKLKYIPLLEEGPPGDGFSAEMKLIRVKGCPYELLQVKWSAYTIAKITDDEWEGIQIWDLKKGVRLLDSYFGIDNMGYNDDVYEEETEVEQETLDSLLTEMQSPDAVSTKLMPTVTKDFITKVMIQNGEVVVSRNPEPNAIGIAASDSVVTPGRYTYKNGKLALIPLSN